MGPNLLQALYDSLNAGKAGVKAAFAPKLGGPDAESAFKSALAGGAGAAMVPIGALDEAATGAGEYMAEDVGRAGAAVERAGMPTLGKALGVGGAALGMIPVAGSFAVDPEAGAAKVAGRSVLEHLAAQNLPEAVMRKAESLQAMYGEDALAKIVKEYADKGVPLFSHDLPMDEASRMARAREMGAWPETYYHGTNKTFYEINPRKFSSGSGAPLRATFASDNPMTAEDFAELAAFNDAQKYKTQAKREAAYKGQQILPLRNLGDSYAIHEPKNPNKMFLDLLDAQGSIEFARENNYPAVYFENVRERTGAASPSNNIAVLSPKDLRSQFAAFDPRMKDSRFLLALKAGAIPLAGLGAAASLEGQ